MLIKRTIEPFIEKALFQGKVIILYGARQVGKTTLAREILKKYPDNSLYLNCDEPDIRVVFTDKTSTEMKSFLGKSRLVVLDEAQRIRDIGLTLKLLADNFPEIQIIATGSSSFDLSNRISEPLTGRYFEFHLYPLSLEELIAAHSGPEVGRLLEQRMVYGSYPEITYSGADAAEKLKNIARSYLFKDILRFQNIRHAEAIEKLLQALALQIGREVSYNELAETAGIDKNTAASYIRIL